MFLYGLYKDDLVKGKNESHISLISYKKGAIERGFTLIAYSQLDAPGLFGWRHLVCGCESAENLVIECNAVWHKATGKCRGFWEMFRLDGREFAVVDTGARKTQVVMEKDLTFF